MKAEPTGKFAADVRSCDGCSTANAWNRRYCRACGNKLTKACAACDFGNASDDVFCGGCGGELATGARSQVEVAARTLITPQAPPPVHTTTSPRVLARKLAELNNSTVQPGAKAPPPVPAKTKGDGSSADDLGQDQIDVLFG